MSPVLTPRLATTVLVARDSERGLEVLMVRRNLRSDFVGGAYVFPGGAVDPEDADASVLARVLGVGGDRVPTGFSTSDQAKVSIVAGVRELFEEAGILLARSQSWSTFDPATWRDEMRRGDRTFREVLEAADLVIEASGIVPLAHWITPEGPSRRYDTRFFVAAAPEDQVASRDDHETIAECWVRPVDALDAQRRGEFEMIFPTIRTLEQIAELDEVAQLMAYARSLTTISPVQPVLVEREGEIIAVLPDGEGPGAR